MGEVWYSVRGQLILVYWNKYYVTNNIKIQTNNNNWDTIMAGLSGKTL